MHSLKRAPFRFAPLSAHYLPAQEQVLLVDADNNPIGSASRQQMRAEKLWHRSSFIFILDPDDSLYVQRRTLTKDVFPGYFDPAPGGVIQASEASDEESALRELEEEMGITGVTLHKLFDYKYEPVKVWASVFFTRWEGELLLQPEEVVEVLMMTPSQVLEAAASGAQVVPDSLAILQHWLSIKG
jgi:isopentenyldiphosphate isomerase